MANVSVAYSPALSASIQTETPISFQAILQTSGYVVTPSGANGSVIGTQMRAYAYTGQDGTGTSTELVSTVAYVNNKTVSVTYTIPSGSKSFSIQGFVDFMPSGSSYGGYTVTWGNPDDATYGYKYFNNLTDPYSKVGKPVSPAVAQTLSRDAVELSWGAGSAAAGNSVTGYDVQYQDRYPNGSWPSGWTTASGSPVTGTKLNVSPPGTVGYYRRFRVRTRGSAGSSYYSDWVISDNTLRRKWDAFGAWTDEALKAGVSGIRAVHLTEIQTRVNTIRAFYGLSAYSFTTVTPRVTKVAKWAALIQEIRAAIDGITDDHEGWNTLEAGRPRIAHITQLRSIIDGL